jgi:hypothetical protein
MVRFASERSGTCIAQLFSSIQYQKQLRIHYKTAQKTGLAGKRAAHEATAESLRATHAVNQGDDA